MPSATVSDSASAPQPTGEAPPARGARRILAVAAVNQPGGAETTLLRLLSGLRGRERMGAGARAWAQRFDRERYTERVERLLAA